MPDQGLIKVVNPHKNSEELLEWKYMNVLILRAQGLTYNEISEKTGFTAKYLSNIFSRGGKLYNVFQRFRQVAQQNQTEEAIDVLFGNLPAVMKSLVETSQMRFDMAAVAAGKTLLEYAMGKPGEMQKSAGPGQAATFMDWVKQETIKENEQRETEQNQSATVEGEASGVSKSGVA